MKTFAEGVLGSAAGRLKDLRYQALLCVCDQPI
jgi:hypothetical protein